MVQSNPFERWGAGRDRPTVFLHGFAGSPESWSRVFERLPSNRVRLGVRLPGHHPRAPVTADSFEAAVDALAAALAAESPDAAHLVGYSLGGRVALGITVRHPALVRRLTLIGAHPGLPTAQARQQRRQADAAWTRLLRSRGIEAFVDTWERQPVFATQQSMGAELLAMQRRVRLSHDPRQLADAMDILGLGAMPDWTPHLPALRLPVQLVIGERDEKFGRLAEQMAQQLPNVTVHRARDAGHNVVLEAPERIAEILGQ
jgi:2-succinyl-6-hydroxy-2,4-cyclohexadiene-1-carboxylate synthase